MLAGGGRKIVFLTKRTIIFYILLILFALVLYLVRTNETGDLFLLSEAPTPNVKFIGLQHLKLGINDPPEIVNFRSFAAAEPPIVFPRAKNLWDDARVKSVLVDDQGQFGSCTACALSYLWQQHTLRSSGNFYRPSRSFWYAQSRKRLGDTNYAADNGSTIRDTAWSLTNMGAISESLYPYTRSTITTAVPAHIETIARPYTLPTRQIIFNSNINTNIRNFKTELNAGRCIMIGVLVYSSFMSRTSLRSGIIPMPNTRREYLMGGHAIALSGWNENTLMFQFRNSWGTSVGQKGLFHIPYAYVCNGKLAGDAWVIG
jgi:C1A family cysteine protease